jgi:hypothetical protein
MKNYWRDEGMKMIYMHCKKGENVQISMLSLYSHILLYRCFRRILGKFIPLNLLG